MIQASEARSISDCSFDLDIELEHIHSVVLEHAQQGYQSVTLVYPNSKPIETISEIMRRNGYSVSAAFIEDNEWHVVIKW